MAFNLVEAVSDPDDCAFNQPCAYGHLVDQHGVYCHNDGWADAPRKCFHTWYWGPDERDLQDADCPGFRPNPDYSEPAP